ncbi:MAG TPA: hypothetical protein VIX41_09520 [Acidimicrobiales bacterium]
MVVGKANGRQNAITLPILNEGVNAIHVAKLRSHHEFRESESPDVARAAKHVAHADPAFVEGEPQFDTERHPAGPARWTAVPYAQSQGNISATFGFCQANFCG